MADLPVVVVFSSLFPSPAQPGAGIFIRERMFRVGQHMPIVVVSPRPWFPLQGIIRYFRPHFRPETPHHLKMDGIDVYYPRYFCFPGIFKGLDGWLMAQGASAITKRLAAERGVSLIDAHFAYPDGYAAAQLATQLDVPVTVTLRGTEWRQCRSGLRTKVKQALQQVSQIFSVSDSLKQVAVGLGIASDKVDVIGNGVDAEKFSPIDKYQARQRYGLPADAKVLITIGGLVERKGFHRVINAMPELLQQEPNLHYLIVGGASAEGNIESQLREQVKQLGLEKNVLYLYNND